MTLPDRIELYLLQQPKRYASFDNLAANLDMDGAKRAELLGALRGLYNVSRITRIGLDIWAIPEKLK